MAGDSGELSYCLIRGEFFPDEARELLMTLIDDKIRFHQRNDWSRRERFGETDIVGVKRIDELRQTKADLAAVLAELGDVGTKLTINCNIGITLTPEG